MPSIKPIHWKKFEKFLFYIGCELKRQESSHRVYSKPGLPRPIIVPTYNPLPVFIIKNNLRILGLENQQYFSILEKLK